jgi:hypothetical protein
MNEQHHGNLLGGAIGDTTQAAAQLATILATAAQTALRLQTRRFEVNRDADEAAVDVQRVELRREYTAARLNWAPAMQPGFKTSGSATDAATAWASAQPWVDHDPSAREAARLAEERLGVLHPELIDRYQERLAAGLDPIDAMVVATVVLTPAPDDVNGAAAARAVAGDERGEALQHSAVPDIAATASVDEHTQGIHAGATHAAASDTATARAALLAAQAYPQPFRGALGRAARMASHTRPPIRQTLHHSRDR